MKAFRNGTITAIATPIGTSAIGKVRVSGEDSLTILKKIFREVRGRKEFESRRVYLGDFIDPGTDKVIDRIHAIYMASPNTYTGEEMVEIDCHGNPIILEKIVEILVKRGARIAEPGEFTRRAFINGKTGLIEAEAVADLINASTEMGIDIVRRQMEGTLSLKIGKIKEDLLEVMARLEAGIDFSEEEGTEPDYRILVKELKRVEAELHQIEMSYKMGRLVQEGITATIIGKVNVGKSSLFNALLNRERALVSRTPGTTRDVVEDTLVERGARITLRDTAGLNLGSDDSLEKMGMRMTRKCARRSSFLLLVLDGSNPLSDEDRRYLKWIRNRDAWIILNKIDKGLNPGNENLPITDERARVFKVSALYGNGIEELRKNICEKYILKKGGDPGIVITSLRQWDLSRKARAYSRGARRALLKTPSPAIALLELKRAVYSLMEMTGEVFSEDILDRIFSKFCIGK